MLRMYEGVLEIAHILPTITFFRKIETGIFCTKKIELHIVIYHIYAFWTCSCYSALNFYPILFKIKMEIFFLEFSIYSLTFEA